MAPKRGKTTVIIEDPVMPGIIGFTPKELFLEINRKIDLLTEISQKKTDHTEFTHLETKVSDMERHGCDLAKDNKTKLVEVTHAVQDLTKDAVTTSALTEFQNKMNENKRTATMQWLAILASILIGGLNLYLRK